MADLFSTLSVISFVVAGVFSALAIAFRFAFKIPAVIGDLSGRTAQKSIEKMRENNEKSGKKNYKSSEKNLGRGKLTETMEGIRRNNDETGLLNENLAKTVDEQETGILLEEEIDNMQEMEETEPLGTTMEIIDRKPSKIQLELLEEIKLIHTDEVIL